MMISILTHWLFEILKSVALKFAIRVHESTLGKLLHMHGSMPHESVAASYAGVGKLLSLGSNSFSQ